MDVTTGDRAGQRALTGTKHGDLWSTRNVQEYGGVMRLVAELSCLRSGWRESRFKVGNLAAGLLYLHGAARWQALLCWNAESPPGPGSGGLLSKVPQGMEYLGTSRREPVP